MVIRIVGEEQVVCDCQGDTSDKYLDKLLVGITESKDQVTVNVFCPECDSSMKCEFTSKLVFKSDFLHSPPTE